MQILKRITIAIVCLWLPLSVSAATIDDLFNTGVDGSGAPLGNSVADPHYTLAGPGGHTAVTTPDNAFPFPPWVANTATSRWIGPNTTSATADPGTYTYTTTFTLPFNTILTSVLLEGDWAADNRDPNAPSLNQIILNGTVVVQGINAGVNGALDGFTAFTPFAFDGNSGAFLVGANTLVFQVWNGGTSPNPTGLHVNFTERSFTTAAPELNSLAAIIALLAIGIIIWRKSIYSPRL